MRLPGGELLRVAVDATRLAVGEGATLGVRAEDLVDGEHAEASLPATLMGAEKLGYETLAHLRVEGVEGNVTRRLEGLPTSRPGRRCSWGSSASAATCSLPTAWPASAGSRCPASSPEAAAAGSHQGRRLRSVA